MLHGGRGMRGADIRSTFYKIRITLKASNENQSNRRLFNSQWLEDEDIIKKYQDKLEDKYEAISTVQGQNDEEIWNAYKEIFN